MHYSVEKLLVDGDLGNLFAGVGLGSLLCCFCHGIPKLELDDGTLTSQRSKNLIHFAS